MSIANRLKTMGITLPAVATPAAAYLPYRISGQMVYLSGHISKRDGAVWQGKFGENLNTAEGKAIAQAVAIDLLGTLQVAAGGDLERVNAIVKIVVLVNATPDFHEHHLVANGCSEFLAHIFTERGAHARAAFGVASIPLGAALEIEMIAELKP